MKYYPMAMHIHTCHQPGGSMEGHMYNAKKLGMQYIHFTDHDGRLGRKANEFSSFDFSLGAIEYSEPNVNKSMVGFESVGECEISSEVGKITARALGNGAEYTESGITLKSAGKRHTSSLLSDISIKLNLDFDIVGDAEFCIDITLSQRPPEYKMAHVKYVFSEPCEYSELTHYVKLEKASDGIYTLNLSRDCEGCEEIGGLDNALSGISFLFKARNGARASLEISKLEIERIYDPQLVLDKQRILADKIGQKYGIKPFVTYEISHAGQHKNVYSSFVPIINYEQLGYSVTEEEAVLHVKKYGGVFGYNHPFENGKFNSVDGDRDVINSIVLDEAKRLSDLNVYGASVMEVGFFDGRGKFLRSDYFKLWDLLTLDGIFITGCGDSDSHYNSLGWFDGQNCCSYVAAPKELPFPVSEEVFNESLKAGRVYFGDPVYINFPIDFYSGKTLMGGILTAKSEEDKKTLSFRADGVEKGYAIDVIINGEKTQRITVNSDADSNFDFELSAPLPVNFARIEIFNKDERCILMTNPIYLVREDLFKKEIPSNRLYN